MDVYFAPDCFVWGSLADQCIDQNQALNFHGKTGAFQAITRFSRDSEPQTCDIKTMQSWAKQHGCLFELERCIALWRQDPHVFNGVTLDRARFMGILNITPDSFSDGGQFLDPDLALNHAQHLHAQKADWIDVGAESTRPGSIAIDALEEIRRLDPVIAQLKAQSNLRISLDSCNAQSFGHYFGGNLSVWNDVCALTQAGSMAYAAQTRPSVVLMHRKPHLMQGSADNYKNVLLDVYDFLAERVASCDKNGITDSAIDPGIGFGKTSANNLILIKYINLFHSVGRPILLGVSRKKVVCQLSSEEIDPLSRLPGCVAIEAYAWSKGIRFFRVHDVRASRQALTCYQMLETA